MEKTIDVYFDETKNAAVVVRRKIAVDYEPAWSYYALEDGKLALFLDLGTKPF